MTAKNTNKIMSFCIFGKASYENTSRWGNKRQSRKRLFSGLLKCGCCGGGMTISRGDRYYCSARREKGTCKADRGIGAAELNCGS